MSFSFLVEHPRLWPLIFVGFLLLKLLTRAVFPLRACVQHEFVAEVSWYDEHLGTTRTASDYNASKNLMFSVL